jgi:hypothetical protein
MRAFKLFLFYLISFTWGIIMSLIGLVVILFSLPFKKVHTYHGRLYATWGRGWGGMELGCFFVCGEDCQYDSLMSHECGHTIQNCIWGPLMPFVVCIPSAFRYWYREFKYHRKNLTPPTKYDDIWFEGQATEWGKKYVLTDKF